MSLGDIYENRILDAIFGASALSVPANFELALSTTTPTDAGGNVTEPVGNGYARVSFANNGTNWASASGGSKANAVDHVFPAATGSWGTITHWVLYDAATADFVMFGSLSPARSVTGGDTFQFLTGDLIITAD